MNIFGKQIYEYFWKMLLTTNIFCVTIMVDIVCVRCRERNLEFEWGKELFFQSSDLTELQKCSGGYT